MSARLEELLRAAREKDEQVAAQAAGASYAAGEDAYRTPEDDADDNDIDSDAPRS